jgi:DNA-binding response OmpR family regulator
MRVVLRRAAGPRHPRLEIRDLEIYLATRLVKVAGEPVQLSAKEYLLVALAEDAGRVFKKEELRQVEAVSLEPSFFDEI